MSKQLSRPEKKFVSDITYGMLASGSCLLTDVADQLHESTKKINTVDHLSRHLQKGTPATAAASYRQVIKKWVPAEPVIHIDDSDVVKPDGYQFEALGIVRDGSESTSSKNVYKKGYHVTEACVITNSNHPVSIFSKMHTRFSAPTIRSIPCFLSIAYISLTMFCCFAPFPVLNKNI